MMRKRILYGALLLAACSEQIGPEEPSGATPATGQSGRAFSVEMNTIAEGPMPWLRSSNLVVENGTLTLSAMAAIGQGIVPYSIKPRTSTGGGFDSTITIEAEVPVGAQLIVGRGRPRRRVRPRASSSASAWEPSRVPRLRSHAAARPSAIRRLSCQRPQVQAP